MFTLTSLFLVLSCSGPLAELQNSFHGVHPNGWSDLRIKSDKAAYLIQRGLNPFDISQRERTPQFWAGFKLLVEATNDGRSYVSSRSLFSYLSDDHRLRLVRAFSRLIVSRSKGRSQISDESIKNSFNRLYHLQSPPTNPDASWFKQKKSELEAFIFNFEVAAALADRGFSVVDIEKIYLSDGRTLAEADILLKKNREYIWIEVKSHIDIEIKRSAEKEIFHQLNHLKSMRLQRFFEANHIDISQIVIVSKKEVKEKTRKAILGRHRVQIYNLDQIKYGTLQF